MKYGRVSARANFASGTYGRRRRRSSSSNTFVVLALAIAWSPTIFGNGTHGSGGKVDVGAGMGVGVGFIPPPNNTSAVPDAGNAAPSVTVPSNLQKHEKKIFNLSSTTTAHATTQPLVTGFDIGDTLDRPKLFEEPMEETDSKGTALTPLTPHGASVESNVTLCWVRMGSGCPNNAKLPPLVTWPSIRDGDTWYQYPLANTRALINLDCEERCSFLKQKCETTDCIPFSGPFAPPPFEMNDPFNPADPVYNAPPDLAPALVPQQARNPSDDSTNSTNASSSTKLFWSSETMDLTILNNSNLSLTASGQWDMWQWECVHNCSLGEVGRLATYHEYCNGLEGDEDLIPYGGVRKGPNGNGRFWAPFYEPYASSDNGWVQVGQGRPSSSQSETCVTYRGMFGDAMNELVVSKRMHVLCACTPLTVCTAAEFQSLEQTEVSDRECTATTVCVDGVEFEKADATAVSDRVCQAYTECGSDFTETTAPTKTTDRVCTPAPATATTSQPDTSTPKLDTFNRGHPPWATATTTTTQTTTTATAAAAATATTASMFAVQCFEGNLIGMLNPMKCSELARVLNSLLHGMCAPTIYAEMDGRGGGVISCVSSPNYSDQPLMHLAFEESRNKNNSAKESCLSTARALNVAITQPPVAHLGPLFSCSAKGDIVGTGTFETCSSSVSYLNFMVALYKHNLFTGCKYPPAATSIDGVGVGCDGVLNSGLVYDDCKVCNGNGPPCTTTVGTATPRSTLDHTYRTTASRLTKPNGSTTSVTATTTPPSEPPKTTSTASASSTTASSTTGTETTTTASSTTGTKTSTTVSSTTVSSTAGTTRPTHFNSIPQLSACTRISNCDLCTDVCLSETPRSTPENLECRNVMQLPKQGPRCSKRVDTFGLVESDDDSNRYGIEVARCSYEQEDIFGNKFYLACMEHPEAFVETTTVTTERPTPTRTARPELSTRNPDVPPIVDQCQGILCALDCGGEHCGWDSGSDTCVPGAITDYTERLRGDCSHYRTTSSEPVRVTMVTTADVGSPGSDTVVPVLDTCLVVGCVLDCTGQCGWNRELGICVSGGITDHAELQARLGDCPDATADNGFGEQSVDRVVVDSTEHQAVVVVSIVVLSIILLALIMHAVKRRRQQPTDAINLLFERFNLLHANARTSLHQNAGFNPQAQPPTYDFAVADAEVEEELQRRRSCSAPPSMLWMTPADVNHGGPGPGPGPGPRVLAEDHVQFTPVEVDHGAV